MSHYLLRRLVALPAVVLAAYSLIFLMARWAPGGPWDMDIRLPPAVLENLRRQFRADEPAWVQYWEFLRNILVHQNLGSSYTGIQRDVGQMITQALPISLQLGGAAVLLAVAVGIPLGVVAAVRRHTALDYLSMAVVLVGISVPTYVIAPLLIVALAVLWHLLPTGGWNGLASSTAVIPVLTLALGPAAGLARYTRSAVLEVIRLEYVRTGRAKGLGQRRLIFRHVLPGALISVVTVVGGYLTTVFTGAFFVESICAIPGMGRLMVYGISNRDYPIILGVSLVVAAGIALVNMAIDVSYALIDPRVRYE